ncbi:uncharacterized protein [Littorina saxatilis]|uniref:Uncharacterized protein n=1 Tax=Littorina saxatilis TaxID=31220 RepID=A0AAN9ASL4_9CAEN
MMTALRPVEVEVSADQTLSWTHFSHLSYDDFSRTETIQHWKLSKVFESGRYHGLYAGVLDFPKIVNRQFTLFVLGIEYTFHPDLWKVPKGMVFPFKISLEVVDMGRTSVTLFSQLVNTLDGRELATSRCKCVYTDRVTRRPVPWPQWIVHKYTPAINQKRSVDLPKAVPEVSALAYSYKVRVGASDTDINGHTNHGSYVRYCCDAAQAALKAGVLVLTPFHRDINRYPLKEHKIMYVGESAMGDNLQVLLWQPQGHEDTVHMVIRRKGNSDQHPVIVHGYMTFGLTPLTHPRL